MYQSMASDGLPDQANQLVVSYEIGMGHELAQDKFTAGMPPSMLLYGNGLMLCSPAVAMPDHTEHMNQLTTNDYTSRKLTRDEVHSFVDKLKASGYDKATEYTRPADSLIYPSSAGRYIWVNTTEGATEASLFPNDPSTNFTAAEKTIQAECAKATTEYDSGKGVAESINLAKDNPDSASAGAELTTDIDVDGATNGRKSKEFTGQAAKDIKNKLGKQAKVYKQGDKIVRARYLTKIPDYNALQPKKKSDRGKVSAATDLKTRWLIVVGAGQTKPDWADTTTITNTSGAIRNWYSGKVGKSFEVNSIQVVRGSKTPAQYKTCPAGYSCRFPEDAIYFNLQNEFKLTGYSTNIFTTFDNNRCMGLGGPASLAINDNWVARYNYGFAVTPFSNGSCDWTAGRRFVAAHELGHTFGLAHTCDGTLMSTSGCPTAPDWPAPALNGTQASLLRNNSPYFNSFPQTPTSTLQWGVNGDIPVPADYNGDGTKDKAIFRPSTSAWWVYGGVNNLVWGIADDTPVPGDYNGDRKADLAVWRPSTGAWWVYGGVNNFVFGQSGDIPVPGDYNGDGKTDFATWRPSDGIWRVNGVQDNMTNIQWGTNGDIPVPGDYNGDGKTDFAVWRPSNGTWWVYGQVGGLQWGLNGDKPVVMDRNGDGKTDFTVWRPSNGTWWVYGQENNLQWGLNGDVPVPGDYNGDRKADFTVWRPSNGIWWFWGI